MSLFSPPLSFSPYFSGHLAPSGAGLSRLSHLFRSSLVILLEFIRLPLCVYFLFCIYSFYIFGFIYIFVFLLVFIYLFIRLSPPHPALSGAGPVRVFLQVGRREREGGEERARQDILCIHV